jgi:hypothetical protein
MKINILDISFIVLKLISLIMVIYILLVSFKIMYPSDYSKIASRINDQYKTLVQGKLDSNVKNKISLWNTAVSKFLKTKRK